MFFFNLKAYRKASRQNSTDGTLSSATVMMMMMNCCIMYFMHVYL